MGEDASGLVDWLAVMLVRPKNVVFLSSPHSLCRETIRALVTVFSFSLVLACWPSWANCTIFCLEGGRDDDSSTSQNNVVLVVYTYFFFNGIVWLYERVIPFSRLNSCSQCTQATICVGSFASISNCGCIWD